MLGNRMPSTTKYCFRADKGWGFHPLSLFGTLYSDIWLSELSLFIQCRLPTISYTVLSSTSHRKTWPHKYRQMKTGIKHTNTHRTRHKFALHRSSVPPFLICRWMHFSHAKLCQALPASFPGFEILPAPFRPDVKSEGVCDVSLHFDLLKRWRKSGIIFGVLFIVIITQGKQHQIMTSK